MMTWVSVVAWLALAGLLWLFVQEIVSRVADQARAAIQSA